MMPWLFSVWSLAAVKQWFHLAMGNTQYIATLAAAAGMYCMLPPGSERRRRTGMVLNVLFTAIIAGPGSWLVLQVFR